MPFKIYFIYFIRSLFEQDSLEVAEGDRFCVFNKRDYKNILNCYRKFKIPDAIKIHKYFRI